MNWLTTVIGLAGGVVGNAGNGNAGNVLRGGQQANEEDAKRRWMKELQWQATMGPRSQRSYARGMLDAIITGRVPRVLKEGFQTAPSADTWALFGYDPDIIASLGLDSSNNIYVAGYTQSAGLMYCVIQKRSASGTVLWTKKMGTLGYTIAGGTRVGATYPSKLILDSDGNIYITGTSTITSGTIDFDGTNYSKPTSTDNAPSAIFVLKLTNTGSYSWLRWIGGTGNENSPSLAVDSLGNVYIGGYSSNSTTSIYFSDKPSYVKPTIQTNGYGGFIGKLNKNGDAVWLKWIIDNSAPNNFIMNIALDSSNNVYVTGYISGYVSMHAPVIRFSDSTSYTRPTLRGFTATFVGKLDTDGKAIWLKWINGGNMIMCYTIALDTSNNVYIGGSSNNTETTLIFSDNTSYTKPTTINWAGFIGKLDTGGNAIWLKWIDGSTQEYVYNIITDSGGNIYISGSSTSGETAIRVSDEASYTKPSTNQGGSAYFFGKLTSLGNPVWLKWIDKPIGSSSGLISGTLYAIDSTGGVYLGGYTGNNDSTFRFADNLSYPKPAITTGKSNMSILAKYVPPDPFKDIYKVARKYITDAECATYLSTFATIRAAIYAGTASDADYLNAFRAMTNAIRKSTLFSSHYQHAVTEQKLGVDTDATVSTADLTTLKSICDWYITTLVQVTTTIKRTRFEDALAVLRTRTNTMITTYGGLVPNIPTTSPNFISNWNIIQSLVSSSNTTMTTGANGIITNQILYETTLFSKTTTSFLDVTGGSLKSMGMDTAFGRVLVTTSTGMPGCQYIYTIPTDKTNTQTYCALDNLSSLTITFTFPIALRISSIRYSSNNIPSVSISSGNNSILNKVDPGPNSGSIGSNWGYDGSKWNQIATVTPGEYSTIQMQLSNPNVIRWSTQSWFGNLNFNIQYTETPDSIAAYYSTQLTRFQTIVDAILKGVPRSKILLFRKVLDDFATCKPATVSYTAPSGTTAYTATTNPEAASAPPTGGTIQDSADWKAINSITTVSQSTPYTTKYKQATVDLLTATVSNINAAITALNSAIASYNTNKASLGLADIPSTIPTNVSTSTLAFSTADISDSVTVENGTLKDDTGNTLGTKLTQLKPLCDANYSKAQTDLNTFQANELSKFATLFNTVVDPIPTTMYTKPTALPTTAQGWATEGTKAAPAIIQYVYNNVYKPNMTYITTKPPFITTCEKYLNVSAGTLKTTITTTTPFTFQTGDTIRTLMDGANDVSDTIRSALASTFNNPNIPATITKPTLSATATIAEYKTALDTLVQNIKTETANKTTVKSSASNLLACIKKQPGCVKPQTATKTV